jgi:hypothetical protein
VSLPSVWRRFLDVIDDENIHRPLLRDEFESKLLLESFQKRGSVRIRLEVRGPFRRPIRVGRIVDREIKFSVESSLVIDWTQLIYRSEGSHRQHCCKLSDGNVL